MLGLGLDLPTRALQAPRGLPWANLPGGNALHAWDFLTNQARWNGVSVGALSNTPGWSFTRASAGYAQNAAGVLVPFASGALRITDRGLLVEGAATNLWLQSQTFDNASWTKTNLLGFGSGSTADAVAAPDGTTTADLITEDTTASAVHGVSQLPSVAANTTFTASVYAKRASGTRHLCLQMVGSGGADSFTIYFNLGTGAVGSSSTAGTASITSSSVQALADGWYRCIVTGIASTGAALGAARIRIASGTTAGSESYTGDGASGLYLWGAQLEAAAFPSSYIPTTTASATRAADALSITSVTGLDYPLTLYAEFERAVDTGGTEILLHVDAGSTNDRARLYVNSSDLSDTQANSGGVSQGNSPVAGAVATGGVTRAAGRVATNSIRTARGGTLATEDTSVAVPATPNAIRLGVNNSGTDHLFGYLRRASLYTRALTDAELQAVTG